MKNLLYEQRLDELHRWLSPPDPSLNYNAALQKRHAGTGSWLLQSEVFETWNSQSSSLLWLYGIPGCGKTILSSTVIEHLGNFLQNKPLLYFYFDFNDIKKQTLGGVVRSLINQLYQKCTNAQEPLNVLYSSLKKDSLKQGEPSCRSLCEVLKKMIERTKELWIVLDAIDECTERKGDSMEGVLMWIRDLVTVRQGNVHCLVTSRPEQDIQSELNELTSEKSRIPIQGKLVRDDISAYIHTKVREGRELKRWRGHEDIQEEIAKRLSEKADSM